MMQRLVDGNLVDMTPAEVAAFEADRFITSDQLAAEARKTRNDLLAASDWTQVADAPVVQAAWAAYRQELRDVTTQAGFPENINWPVAP